MDAALFQWFTAARSQSVLISGQILKAKAEELNTEITRISGVAQVDGSHLGRFRHNTWYRSVCGENAAVDKDVCDEWTVTVLLPVLRRYDPCDVFNADETGFYWLLAIAFEKQGLFCQLKTKVMRVWWHQKKRLRCTFKKYVCSDENLQCTPMFSSADIVATLGRDC